MLAPFVDLFVIGDGEESLPWVMERWMTPQGRQRRASVDGADRICSPRWSAAPTWAYAPMFYEPEYHADGTIAAMNRTRSRRAARDLGLHHHSRTSTPSRCRPGRSCRSCKTPHDRIAIEIMRGCPWQCRFCQSTVIKRPLRVRSVETIVQAALESYRNTGYDEISLLSLSAPAIIRTSRNWSSACTRCSRRWASTSRCRACASTISSGRCRS